MRPPDLPQVEVDRSQIERVIANLVTNAMRRDAGGRRDQRGGDAPR